MIINPGSTQQLTILLFGGEIKDREQVQIGEYKTGKHKGQPKYQWKEIKIQIKGLGLTPNEDWLTEKGNISLNDKILSQIAKKTKHPAGIVANKVLELRGLKKEISTYYVGMEELIMDYDSCIHAQFSHCGYDDEGMTRGGTSTGRLSSHHPNFQNIPKS